MCLIVEDPQSGTIDKPVRTGYKNVEIVGVFMMRFSGMIDCLFYSIRGDWLVFLKCQIVHIKLICNIVTIFDYF